MSLDKKVIKDFVAAVNKKEETKTPTADTATKNLTALTAQVKEAETTIKKNKEEIELRAKMTEVTEAIDNIDIGGRNLAKNTATLPIGNGTWNTGTWRRSGTGSISNVDINDSPIPQLMLYVITIRHR